MPPIDEQLHAYARWLESMRDRGELEAAPRPGGPELVELSMPADPSWRRRHLPWVGGFVAAIAALVVLLRVVGGGDTEVRTADGSEAAVASSTTETPTTSGAPLVSLAPAMGTRCDVAAGTLEVTYGVENTGDVAVRLVDAQVSGAHTAVVTLLPEVVAAKVRATASEAGVADVAGPVTFTVTFETLAGERHEAAIELDFLGTCG